MVFIFLLTNKATNYQGRYSPSRSLPLGPCGNEYGLNTMLLRLSCLAVLLFEPLHDCQGHDIFCFHYYTIYLPWCVRTYGRRASLVLRICLRIGYFHMP